MIKKNTTENRKLTKIAIGSKKNKKQTPLKKSIIKKDKVDKQSLNKKKAKGIAAKINKLSLPNKIQNFNHAIDISKQNIPRPTISDTVMRYGYDQNKIHAICTFSNVSKEVQRSPETRVWRAVIMQAMLDVVSIAKRGSAKVAKFSAEQWMDLSNPSFLLVCSFAKLDPKTVYSRSKTIANPKEIEAFFKSDLSQDDDMSIAC